MSKQIRLFALFFVLYEINAYLSNDMIMPGMLQVVGQFHTSVDKIALSLSLYVIGGSSLQIFLGPIADAIGKRKVLLFGNAIFLFATLIITLSHSINQFLAARFFQGTGLCFIFIGYAVIHDLMDDVNAVKFIAILANISLLAPLIGPVLGTLIIAHTNWVHIFIITAILGIISLIGLSKYMPKQSSQITNKIDVRLILKSYKAIFTNKMFVLGLSSYSLGMIPIFSWIGMSPVIILHTMHKSSVTYIIYQSIVFGGFVLSSLVINRFAGTFSFYSIIRSGSHLFLSGVIVAFIFSGLPNIFMFGMFTFSFGYGLCCGSIMRISLMSTGKSMNLTSAAMSLIICLYLAGGLEISNIMCNYWGYTLRSIALINLVTISLAFIGAKLFAKYNKNRQWDIKTP